MYPACKNEPVLKKVLSSKAIGNLQESADNELLIKILGGKHKAKHVLALGDNEESIFGSSQGTATPRSTTSVGTCRSLPSLALESPETHNADCDPPLIRIGRAP